MATRRKSEGGGFMDLIREVAKPFPEWTEISDYFRRPDGTVWCNVGGYKKRAAEAGCLLRIRNWRVYVTLRPGLSQPIKPYPKQYISPPHGDV